MVPLREAGRLGSHKSLVRSPVTSSVMECYEYVPKQEKNSQFKEHFPLSPPQERTIMEFSS